LKNPTESWDWQGLSRNEFGHKILCFDILSKYNIRLHREKSESGFILVKSQNGHLFYVQILKNYSIYKRVFSEKSLQSIML
jgi:hypothetical protein